MIEQPWFILNSLPHMKVVGYRVKNFRDPEAGTSVLAVERCGRTELAEMAYLYYQASDLPDLSPFHEMDVSFGIVADAYHIPGRTVAVRVEGDAPEDALANGSPMKDLNEELAKTPQAPDWIRDGLESRSAEGPNNNGALALTVRDPVWMKIWAESQERIINQEADEILESNLPDDEKLVELEKRERQLADLPKLLDGMVKETRIRLQRTANPDQLRASVKLAMGYVLTETTFNRGNYVSLKKFAKSLKIA